MKTISALSILLCVSLLALFIGCNDFDTGINPENEFSTISEAELAKLATASYEYSSFDAVGDAPEYKNAVFSVGWGKFYNPIEEAILERSDAFAVAPDTTRQNNRDFRRHFGGKDMGTVSLNYGSESVELFRIEMDDGSVFYNFGKRKPGNPRGMLHEDEGEVSEEIPYIPGQTYRFDATGSESFPAVSLEITAPIESLQITSPEAGTEIDSTSGLDISWQGGDTSQKLMVGLVPLLDRGTFERDHGGPGQGGPDGGQNGRPGGPGHGGPNNRQNGRTGGPGQGGPNNGPGGPGLGGPDGGRHNGPGGPGKHPHLHFRYLVEENTGSFTVPVEDMQELLSIPGVNGVLVQVMQMVTSDVEDGDSKYAIQLRNGDAVQLGISE